MIVTKHYQIDEADPISSRGLTHPESLLGSIFDIIFFTVATISLHLRVRANSNERQFLDLKTLRSHSHC